MAIFTFGWCRTEGTPIPDLQKEYGTFTNLPASTKVFYGTPEIQIYNPYSTVNGCVYKIVPLSTFGGYTTIKDIDANYSDILQGINNYDKTVDTEHGSIYYYEPFVVEESCVIFHTDSTRTTFDQKAIILIDQFATPEILTITAKYIGGPVPIGEKFDLDNMQIYAIYSDGNKALIKQGYTVEPEDQIITVLGSNVVKITYVTPTGNIYQASVIVEGVKNLVGIQAFYDGPAVSYGQEALKKYFVTVAQYSDGSSATVTEFSFPSGNVVSETNGGIITIFYKGFYTDVEVPTYEVSSSRLIAFYNGPNVEVGNPFDTKYAQIKIYYKSADEINSYYEDIDPGLCIFSTTMVDHEGVNQILVQYVGKAGPVSTYMIVIGIKPEVQLNFIEAEYTGPEIIQGKSYSVERVIVKAHYSNGDVVQVKNFSVNSNIVNFVGLNEYEVTYKEKDTTVTTTFGVIGIERDSTSDTNYTPISLQNHYPEATRVNHRYRGPAEGMKNDKVNMMIFENIAALYKVFRDIEIAFNELSDAVGNNNAIKYRTLNNIERLEDGVDKWLNDDRFTPGKYVEKGEGA